MKVAVVYNRDSKNVINLFGAPNQEKIGMRTIGRLTKALTSGGNQVQAFEADKELINRLEEFMPRVIKGEQPGMVFNVSYGLQGQARYTHVPSILEMVGIPYVASGPLGHSLALDKVVTKMILRQQNIPTPEFTVLETPEAPIPGDVAYPAIVKPKNEAVSFGLRVVNNDDELREGAGVIFEAYHQPVLVERFIEGREINVGILGNCPPEPFPPVELSFGVDGPQIYTYEDKTGRSGRSIEPVCPAPISDELTAEAQDIAVRSFRALGLYDCARVDLRLDDEGNLYVLEVNSLPSLGEHGSYLVGAAYVGLDFEGFVNRLLDVARARYFGTPTPPVVDGAKADPRKHAVAYVTQRRDRIERRVKEWVELPSAFDDPVGLQRAMTRAGNLFDELAMKPIPELTDAPQVGAWETQAGLDGGTLFLAGLDTPRSQLSPTQPFRRDPEKLYGEAVGQRAGLVMLEYALRSLRSIRRLRRLPLGVMLCTDEVLGCRKSAEISQAAARAQRVFVLAPSPESDGIVLRRRGNRKLTLQVTGNPILPVQTTQRQATTRWTIAKLEQIVQLTSRSKAVSVSILDLATHGYAQYLPHQVRAGLLITYQDRERATELEREIRAILGRRGCRWDLTVDWDRPPMPETDQNAALLERWNDVADQHGISFQRTTSSVASLGGLVAATTPSLCGIGPAAHGRSTPDEHIERISLIERTLVLTEFLAQELPA
ncbi:ATP-grasp domain-containing protein [Candidatus Poriferisocius sp.]|uniref:ATP-grasp domain-containing protein n=1 Tax=Candidatus Poriferisocius sp. TaxID=3101276 RepID=UPI003B5A83F2